MADLEDCALMNQIDKCLSRLYQREGLEYDQMFKERCNDNGYDDNEAINDELKYGLDDWAESQIMDDDFLEGMFPWIPDDDNRNPSIYAIFVKCFKDPNAYDANSNKIPMALDPTYWNITDGDLSMVEYTLRDLAPSIYDGGFHGDHCLKSMVAVEFKMKRNYMQLLADMYMREHIFQQALKRPSASTPFNVADWAQVNKHILALCNMKPVALNVGGKTQSYTPGSLAESAVKSYFHRVAPRLQLVQVTPIRADLQTVVEHIALTVDFVAHLTNSSESTCPFQYDAVFAFDEFVEDPEDENEDGDDDDADGIDADDNKDDSNDLVLMGANIDIDSLPQIQEDLTKIQLSYAVADLSKSQHDKDRGARALKEPFDNLKRDILKGGGAKMYPRNHRFCSVLDLRSNQGGDDGQKSVVMFESYKGIEPEKWNYVPPGDNTSFGYFHRAKSCIIPGTTKKQKAKMTAMSGGPHMTMSFHVDEQNDMRCYLYINGQCSRFLPEDIKLLLPIYFEQTEANTKYAASKEAGFIIQRISNSLKDEAFTAFLEKYEVMYNLDHLQEARDAMEDVD